MGAPETLAWVGFIINLLAGLIMAWLLFHVHQYRYRVEWSARHYDQLFYAAIWSVLFVGVERNLQLFGSSLLDLSESFELGFAGKWFLNNLFGIGFLSLYLLRAWLIHYDYHAGLSLFILVFSDKASLKENQIEHFEWFLDNKSNYGAPKFMTRFTLFIILGLNGFMLMWSLISASSFIYAMIFIYAIMIVISISITRHIVLLEDNFFIQREILMEFRIFAMMFVIGGILLVFAPAMGWEYAFVLMVELTVICIFSMHFIATYYVLSATQNVGMNEQIVPPKNTHRIHDALKNAAATSEFIKHLIKEVSVENIFFLSDIMAYKESLVKRGKLNKVHGFSCDVDTSISRLIYRRTFYRYAQSITKTYIDGSSAFYVTAISGDIREKIIDFFGDDKTALAETNDSHYDWIQLQELFDSAAEEVFHILKDSYSRFAYTNQYNEIVWNKDLEKASSGTMR